VAPRLLWQQVHDVLNDIRSAAPAVDDRLPSELEMAGAQGPIGFASCSRTTRRWCGTVMASWPHGKTPPHLPVVQLAGGGEPGRGGDGRGCLVAGMNVGDDGLD